MIEKITMIYFINRYMSKQFYDFSEYVFSEPLWKVPACHNVGTDAQIQENVFQHVFLC